MCVKCKDCYVELEDIENEDFELADNYFYLYKSGKCPECNKTYQWRDFHSLNYEGSEFLEKGDK